MSECQNGAAGQGQKQANIVQPNPHPNLGILVCGRDHINQVMSDGIERTPKMVSKAIRPEISRSTVPNLMKRMADSGDLVRLRHGWYRKPVIKDMLDGRIPTAVFGLHGIVFRGKTKSTRIPTRWGKSLPPVSGQGTGLLEGVDSGVVAGPCGVKIEFRACENGTFMVYWSNTTDKPLSVPEYCQVLGYMEGYIGPEIYDMGLMLVEVGVSTDLGRFQMDGISSISLSPWGWRDVILRIYNHKKRLRAEAHAKEAKAGELLKVLLTMAGIEPGPTVGP